MSMTAVGFAPVRRDFFPGGDSRVDFDPELLGAEEDADELASVIDAVPLGCVSALGRVECEVRGAQNARLRLAMVGMSEAALRGIWAGAAECPFAPMTQQRVWWLRGFAGVLRAAEDEILAGM